MKLELQQLLDERGISVEQLASETGLPEKKLKKVLDNDIEAVRLSTLETLCRYFDVGPEVLLK